MNILKIIHGYPPIYNAGSEVYSQSICNELSKTHKISIFTRESNPFEADFTIRQLSENQNLSIYLVNRAREKDGYHHPKLDTLFGNWLDANKPDIAHIGHLNHLSTGLVNELSIRNIPIIFTLHDFWLMCPRGQFLQINFGETEFHQLCAKQDDSLCVTKCYNRYFSGKEENYETDFEYWKNWISVRMQVTKRIAQQVDMFIAPSKYLMQRFITDFDIPMNKITYLDYGFPVQYLQPTQNKPSASFRFGYIGTHIASKGIDYLLKAFAQLKGDAELKIWGRETAQETNALKMLANKICRKNSVKFMGEYINNQVVERVFSEIDCIVVPSIWCENSPLVIHEAQQCKIPVITADAGGMAEYVHQQVNGFLFKHRNINDLAKVMQYAMDNPENTKRVGERGYLYSNSGEVIDIQTHCKELVKLYSHLIQQKNAQ